MLPPASTTPTPASWSRCSTRATTTSSSTREAWDRLVTWIDLNVPDHGTWHEHRAIPNGQRQRRQELRKLLRRHRRGLRGHPRTATEPIEPILPEPPTTGEMVAVECPGWPFDDGEAQRRQGDDRERKITVDVGWPAAAGTDAGPHPGGRVRHGRRDGCGGRRTAVRVRIERPFWIAKTEITNEQFALFDPATTAGTWTAQARTIRTAAHR